MKNFSEIFSRIKLVLSDLDGCLTDGGMYYDNKGQMLKKFNVKDGMGNRLLREAGLKTGVITTDASDIIEARGQKLKIDFIARGIWNKHEAALEICSDLGISPEEVVYLGDDINDIELLKIAGFSACPADAVDEVKNICDIVLQKKGGEGAFRELADMILRSRVAEKEPDFK